MGSAGNCTDLLVSRYLPTPDESFTVLGDLATILVCVGAVSVCFVFILFIQESITLSRFWPLKTYILMWGCLSIFPVTCFCLFLTILVPRSSEYTNPIVLLYLPVPLIFFYELVVSYAGGEENLLLTLLGEKVILQGPPICCVCWFCPRPKLTRKRFRFMKISIYQLLFFHIIVFICTIVTDSLGLYRMGELNLESAAPYLLLLNGLSFFAGVYGIVVFTRLCSFHFPGFALRSKFIVLQLNFLLVRAHFFAFDFFGKLGVLPCQPPLSSYATGLYLRSALLLSECFILAILARIFFMRAPPVPTDDDESTVNIPKNVT